MINRIATFLFFLAAWTATGIAAPPEDSQPAPGWEDVERHLMQWQHLHLEGIVTQYFESSVEMQVGVAANAMRDGEQLILRTVVTSPATLQGMAMLAHRGQTDLRGWMFLPSRQQVSEMDGADLSLPYMGTEFAVEDMLPPDRDRFEIGEPTADIETGLYRFVARPREARREVAWLEIFVSPDARQIHRIDYIDSKSRLVKTLRLSSFRPLANGQQFATVNEMSNHQTGYRSVIEWQQVTERDSAQEFLQDPNELGREFYAAHPDLVGQ